MLKQKVQILVHRMYWYTKYHQDVESYEAEMEVKLSH
jgi:hypothetical protein